MRFQDAIRVFHEPECGGIIVSEAGGRLKCAVWRYRGHIDPEVFRQILEVLGRLFDDS